MNLIEHRQEELQKKAEEEKKRAEEEQPRSQGVDGTSSLFGESGHVFINHFLLKIRNG